MNNTFIWNDLFGEALAAVVGQVPQDTQQFYSALEPFNSLSKAFTSSPSRSRRNTLSNSNHSSVQDQFEIPNEAAAP